MFGDITPGDTTHHDFILLYQNYFRTAFRNLPRELPDKQKFEVLEMISDIIQVCS